MFDRNYHLMRDHWFIPKVLLVFVITCMILAVFYKGFDIYFSKEMKDHIAGKALFDQKNGKIAWLIIMLVWIPNYISYLPGVFTVDAINQIEQFASHNLTNHHPILTTFIEAPIVLLGKHMGYLGIGLAIYLLLIFILSSYIISRGFAWMSKHHTPYAIRTIMLVYFCIYPIWSAYARTLVKDTLFYPVFYLYILFFFDLLIDHKRLLSQKRKLVQFIVLSILLCLVRHNGFYVVVVTMVGLIIFCKGNRKKCTVLLIGLVAFWQIYNAVTIEKRIKGEVERTRNEIDSYFNKQKVENLYMLTIVNGISQSRMDVMEKKYDSALFCCIYTIDAALKANTPDIAQTCLNMVIDSIIPGFKRQMTKETAKENKANYIQILKKMNDDRVIDLIVYLRSL